jgi:hypothetical protein
MPKHRRPRRSQPSLTNAPQALYWLARTLLVLKEHWHWF